MMATDGGLSLTTDGDTDFLRAVESSTCLLLAASPSPTPTPPHPLANVALYSAEDGCSGQLHPEDAAADSSSSGDSGSVALRHDPVSAQLINNINMLEYRTLSKVDRLPSDENIECKLNGAMSASNRTLPKFVEWNWVLVRRALLWVVVSGLAACAAAVAAMIVTLPRSCEPQLPWHQGALFYEVFPASFADSNNDAYGDLRGLKNKLDYIQDLGASTIRLNYIYEASEYPEHYTDVTNLTQIASNIGTLKDFEDLVGEVHRRNMSIVLDIPAKSAIDSNSTAVDPIEQALSFWCRYKVDGFYLKDLETIASDPNFDSSLRRWKKAIGYGRIVMASKRAYDATSGTARNVLLSKLDLLDVQLDTTGGVDNLKMQIESVLSGPLFEKPSYPWIHWNMGDVSSERLGSKNKRDAVALILLTMTLPGTVSIFYGDEIGLQGLPENSEGDFTEHHLVQGLVAMRWPGNTQPDGSCAVRTSGLLPWNCGHERPDFHKVSTVKEAVELRTRTPTLHSSWVKSDNDWRGNAEIRKAPAMVLERWLPRRHSYVYVGNPDSSRLDADLSTSFYAGTVVSATNSTVIGTHVYFDQIVLKPHEAMIVELEK